MSRTPVFHRVAAEAGSRRGYSDELHDRVDALVNEWLNLPEGKGVAFAKTEEAFAGEVKDCEDYVIESYRQQYGVGLPVIGFLMWPIMCGIITWIVHRTLDAMFRGGNENQEPKVFE